MFLKNYTSEVPVTQTIYRIEQALIWAGVQSERTAWKLIQDWVEVQLSMISLKQADFVQVFLPYVWNGQRTYYQALKESN
jgi:hypothetical protein